MTKTEFWTNGEQYVLTDASADTTPDLSEIARMMLQWEQLKLRLDELEAAIEGSTMQIGETQTAGNVVAKYSGGRKTYDYEAAALTAEVSSESIAKHTSTKEITTTDWRTLCRADKIADVPFTKSEPRVTVKLK